MLRYFIIATLLTVGLSFSFAIEEPIGKPNPYQPNEIATQSLMHQPSLTFDKNGEVDEKAMESMVMTNTVLKDFQAAHSGKHYDYSIAKQEAVTGAVIRSLFIVYAQEHNGQTIGSKQPIFVIKTFKSIDKASEEYEGLGHLAKSKEYANIKATEYAPEIILAAGVLKYKDQHGQEQLAIIMPFAQGRPLYEYLRDINTFNLDNHFEIIGRSIAALEIANLQNPEAKNWDELISFTHSDLHDSNLRYNVTYKIPILIDNGGFKKVLLKDELDKLLVEKIGEMVREWRVITMFLSQVEQDDLNNKNKSLEEVLQKIDQNIAMERNELKNMDMEVRTLRNISSASGRVDYLVKLADEKDEQIKALRKKRKQITDEISEIFTQKRILQEKFNYIYIQNTAKYLQAIKGFEKGYSSLFKAKRLPTPEKYFEKDIFETPQYKNILSEYFPKP